MIVTVTLRVEVDPARWDNGELAGSPQRSGTDVAVHVVNLVRHSALLDEAGASVDLVGQPRIKP